MGDLRQCNHKSSHRVNINWLPMTKVLATLVIAKVKQLFHLRHTNEKLLLNEVYCRSKPTGVLTEDMSF